MKPTRGELIEAVRRLLLDPETHHDFAEQLFIRETGRVAAPSYFGVFAMQKGRMVLLIGPFADYDDADNHWGNYMGPEGVFVWGCNHAGVPVEGDPMERPL